MDSKGKRKQASHWGYQDARRVTSDGVQEVCCSPGGKKFRDHPKLIISRIRKLCGADGEIEVNQPRRPAETAATFPRGSGVDGESPRRRQGSSPWFPSAGSAHRGSTPGARPGARNKPGGGLALGISWRLAPGVTQRRRPPGGSEGAETAGRTPPAKDRSDRFRDG